MFTHNIFLLSLFINRGYMYTNMATDYDMYGIKIAMNDRFMVSLDNLFSIWYIEILSGNQDLSCTANYTLTTCEFVYSVVTPLTNNRSFVYNCVSSQGKNVIGTIIHINMCDFHLIDEQIVSNYSTQDNFVIDLNEQGTGVYGFADDFVLFYELQPTNHLFIWQNTLSISPRAMDIGANNEYAVVVGYCQLKPSKAVECGFFVRLNESYSCPYIINNFPISTVLTYPWTDPRAAHFITQSRVYTTPLVMSVSIAWLAQLVLIGVPSLNTVLLYSLNNTQKPISFRQNGIGFMGFGKSVAWLDDRGEKAAVLANNYSYSMYQWISSSIHVYNIQSDGFTDETQPILVYPNSQQILHPSLVPSFLRITTSPSGSVAIFDFLGNAVAIITSPAGTFPSTNTSNFLSIAATCNPGTHRDYDGIELCYPCSSSSNCSLCTSIDSFCPYGAVGEIAYTAFESIEQEQEYPESPENTVFDDILMQNMFLFNIRSAHCLLVSPMTWVLVIMGLGFTVAISMAISEAICPNKHLMRDRAKKIFRKMDLVGEGEVLFWILSVRSS
jgi:hypothetical protein